MILTYFHFVDVIVHFLIISSEKLNEILKQIFNLGF